MNEINVHTERGIYTSGEVVFGAIYLKIIKPTQVSGINLKFEGFVEVIFDKFKHRENILSNMYEVYTMGKPFDIGYYAFPFKIALPLKLPGSLLIENAADPHYHLEISYRLEVRGRNSTVLVADYPVVIYQDDSLAMLVEPASVCEQFEFPMFPGLVKGDLSIKASVNKPVYEFGDEISFLLELKNRTRHSIDSVCIKLIRCLDVTVNNSGRRVRVESVLWGCLLPGTDEKGAERRETLMIGVPLPSAQEFSPTVTTKLFMCFHQIEVAVSMASGKQVQKRLKVGTILPNDNGAWSQWRTPHWAHPEKCSLVRLDPQSPVRVSDADMASQHFSSLPVLRQRGTTAL